MKWRRDLIIQWRLPFSFYNLVVVYRIDVTYEIVWKMVEKRKRISSIRVKLNSSFLMTYLPDSWPDSALCLVSLTRMDLGAATTRSWPGARLLTSGNWSFFQTCQLSLLEKLVFILQSVAKSEIKDEVLLVLKMLICWSPKNDMEISVCILDWSTS